MVTAVSPSLDDLQSDLATSKGWSLIPLPLNHCNLNDMFLINTMWLITLQFLLAFPQCPILCANFHTLSHNLDIHFKSKHFSLVFFFLLFKNSLSVLNLCIKNSFYSGLPFHSLNDVLNEQEILILI